MKSDLLVYWNGRWLPSDRVAVPLDDLGFLMGVTVVERLRSFEGQLFRIDKHMARMHRSLEIMGWDAAALCREIEAALTGFIDRNGPTLPKSDDWTVVAFVTPGQLAAATQPTVCVHGSPLPFQRWAAQFETGLDAVIVDAKQVPENSWPAELKCRSRMHYFLADQQAEKRVPGARAILLDQRGFVGEGSTANVVAYFADRGLVTPHRSRVLPGVSQEVLYELADSLKLPRSEADILPSELAEADELYFTSTSICLLPVVRLNGKAIGTGQPGAWYNRLLSAWSRMVGVDIAEQARLFQHR